MNKHINDFITQTVAVTGSHPHALPLVALNVSHHTLRTCNNVRLVAYLTGYETIEGQPEVSDFALVIDGVRPSWVGGSEMTVTLSDGSPVTYHRGTDGYPSTLAFGLSPIEQVYEPRVNAKGQRSHSYEYGDALWREAVDKFEALGAV